MVFGIKEYLHLFRNQVEVSAATVDFPDDTFVTTLCAGFYKRLRRQHKKLTIKLEIKDAYGACSADQISFSPMSDLSDVVHITELYRISNDAFSELSKSKARFTLNFEYLAAVSIYLTSKAKVQTIVFYNSEHNLTWMLVKGKNDIDLELLEAALQAASSAIAKLLPWMFPDDDKITPEEYEFLKMISERNYSGVKAKIDELVNSRELRNEQLAETLNCFLLNKLRNKQSKIDAEIASHNESISALYRDIQEHNNAIEKLNLEAFMLTQKDYDNEKDELISFIRTCPGIEIRNVLPERLDFTVSTYLDSINESLFSPCVTLAKSTAYLFRDITYPIESMREFYRACWVTGKFKIRVWASFYITSDARLQPNGNHMSCPEDRIPNPHQFYASCFGGFNTSIMQAAEAKDFVGAMQIAIAATKNINLSDMMAMHLPRDLMARKERAIIEDTNGNQITFREAMKIIEREGA